MSDYDNTDSGALFRNDRKETDKHPDLRGSIDVGGVEYWISAWSKTPKAGGDKFLSLAVTKKEGQGASKSLPEVDDDLPF
jgi:uncharacterized protein (DUF736 family)